MGFLIGYAEVNYHKYGTDIANNSACRFCGLENQIIRNIFGDCEVLVSKRSDLRCGLHRRALPWSREYSGPTPILEKGVRTELGTTRQATVPQGLKQNSLTQSINKWIIHEFWGKKSASYPTFFMNKIIIKKIIQLCIIIFVIF